MKIFDFSNYRQYLEETLESNGRRSGIKTRASAAMDVQPAFFSRVLAAQADLSLEQADKLSRFLGHSPDERHYFLLLVQHDRAGSSSLRSYFRDQIEREKENRKNVSEQIKPSNVISPQAESRYYSTWIYAAVHVLLSIENLRTVGTLSQALNLPSTLIAEVLDFLVSHGLAKREGERYMTGHVHLHLRRGSDHIVRHHSNWRMKSIESLSQSIGDEVRYSAVLTLNEECASRISEELVATLKQTLSQVEASPAETAYVYNLDFFRLLKA